MQGHGVLFVQDPVVSLDLAEILASVLSPTKLHIAASAAEAGAMVPGAAWIVTDRSGSEELSNTPVSREIPHLYVGSNDERTPLSDVFARIDLPFTNASVNEALNALGLII